MREAGRILRPEKSAETEPPMEEEEERKGVDRREGLREEDGVREEDACDSFILASGNEWEAMVATSIAAAAAVNGGK